MNEKENLPAFDLEDIMKEFSSGADPAEDESAEALLEETEAEQLREEVEEVLNQELPKKTPAPESAVRMRPSAWSCLHGRRPR